MDLRPRRARNQVPAIARKRARPADSNRPSVGIATTPPRMISADSVSAVKSGKIQVWKRVYAPAGTCMPDPKAGESCCHSKSRLEHSFGSRCSA